ncbi:hypothetical protein RND81_10G020300 [Saponaria officinalis]|uniref:BHLH domain-containing protein n=1 Tax=Saponaria officinalis TaxID=3572 RepID=A0AAW1HXQ9_SAPOF
MGNCDEEQELDPSWVCCLLEDVPANCCDAFSFDSALHVPVCSDHPFVGPASVSKNSNNSCGISDGSDECCRKRFRGGSSCTTSSRACREKLRRDRVNERFLELSAVLDPGKAPKLDKAVILTDAVQMVKMLQQETATLKNQNVELQQKNNELKAEKRELRSEKHRLKKVKDDIELCIKALGVPHGMKFRPCITTPTSFGIPTQPTGAKLMPVFNYPGVPLWHFAPHASVDTSQDHAFHPPVA